MVIRPERVVLAALGTGNVAALPARIERLVYVGSVTQVLLRVGEHPLQALVANDGAALCGGEGDMVDAHLPASAIRLLPSSA
jgi:hypothetical protein